jgi:hypothetical protein
LEEKVTLHLSKPGRAESELWHDAIQPLLNLFCLFKFPLHRFAIMGATLYEKQLKIHTLFGGKTMFKKLLIGTLAAVIAVAAGASACTALAAPLADTQPVVVAESVAVEPVAASSVDVVTAAEITVQTVTTAALTAGETAGLLYMYEEEKLARDVYNALYALWGQTTFQSIATSEQTHMDSVKVLLDRYGIAAPSSAAGSFSDPTLQSLYNSLMSTGSLSLADALKVGATIEEVDIVDLQSHLALTTTADIQLVYNNLMSGSYNHLRNFVTVLQRLTGEVYQPQYLNTDLYQTIVSDINGNGQRYGSTTTPPGRGRGASTGSVTTSSTTASMSKGHRGGR